MRNKLQNTTVFGKGVFLLKWTDYHNYKGKGSQLRYDSEKEKYQRRWLSLYEYKEVFQEKLPDKCYTNDFRKDELICKWCASKLPNKRRKSFCCNECSSKYGRVTVWDRGMAALPYKIACRDLFYCRITGEDLAYTNQYGMRLPCSNQNLEIHHLILVSEGGSDHESNLITVSKQVHRDYHSNIKYAVELINTIRDQQLNEKMFIY